MKLTPTTRELIISRLDEIREKIELLETCIRKSKEQQTDHFDQMHFIEIDILKGERKRLTDAIIKDEFIEQ